MQLIEPFGPKIGQCRLPDDVFNTLLDITDHILLNPEEYTRTGYEYWDGKWDEQWPCKNQFDIPVELYHLSNVYKYLSGQVIKYIQSAGTHSESIPDDANVDIFHSWFNSMTKNEDMPAHNHHGLVSGVIYCKVPYTSRDDPRFYREGILQIINGSSIIDGLENGYVQLLPEEKTMYLFPSRMFHGVSSYSINAERRSISFNAYVSSYTYHE